jgi:hypothetical protein
MENNNNNHVNDDSDSSSDDESGPGSDFSDSSSDSGMDQGPAQPHDLLDDPIFDQIEAEIEAERNAMVLRPVAVEFRGNNGAAIPVDPEPQPATMEGLIRNAVARFDLINDSDNATYSDASVSSMSSD